MFFVKLLRFLRGTVLFKLTGGFSERFINLCGRGGIPLWDFTAHPLGFSAHTTAKGYKRMRPYAKKTGVKIRIQRKEGVPLPPTPVPQTHRPSGGPSGRSGASWLYERVCLED